MGHDNYKVKFSSHAIQRMFERNIQKDTVIEAAKNGEIIFEYPEDNPYPSSLKLSIIERKPIHVVSAFNEQENEIYIITVYLPDKKIWADDFKTRRK